MAECLTEPNSSSESLHSTTCAQNNCSAAPQGSQRRLKKGFNVGPSVRPSGRRIRCNQITISLSLSPWLKNQEQAQVTRYLFSKQEGPWKPGAEVELLHPKAAYPLSSPDLTSAPIYIGYNAHVKKKPEFEANGIRASLLPHPILTSPDCCRLGKM